LPKWGGSPQTFFEKRGGRDPLLFFWRGGSPLIEMGNPPLSRGSTGRMLSVMTPREAVPPFMQKEGGGVPTLPDRGGVVQNIFKKRGGLAPPLFF